MQGFNGKNTCIFKNPAKNTWICKHSYRKTEHLPIRVFLQYLRILAYTIILTLWQNNCIFEYSYRVAE